MDKEAYLDQVFSQGAKDQLAYAKGKIFNYNLLDDNYQVIKTGRCSVENRYYDKSIDCDVITIKDLDTEEFITEHQFKLDLYETKEEVGV